MSRNFINAPDRKTISELLGKFEELASGLEELQCDLADSIECYMEDADDLLSEAECYLDGAAQEHDLNRRLARELNAGRKELLLLLSRLEENGLSPHAGTFIHYSRLDPGFYAQDPGSPFYLQDSDGHYNSLLTSQLEELSYFESVTPMTTNEREALRTYIVEKTGLKDNGPEEWAAVLRDMRS